MRAGSREFYGFMRQGSVESNVEGRGRVGVAGDASNCAYLTLFVATMRCSTIGSGDQPVIDVSSHKISQKSTVISILSLLSEQSRAPTCCTVPLPIPPVCTIAAGLLASRSSRDPLHAVRRAN